jgi:hypothetical protein
MAREVWNFDRCYTLVLSALDGRLTPIQTGRLTVGHNIILTLTLQAVAQREAEWREGAVVKIDCEL